MCQACELISHRALSVPGSVAAAVWIPTTAADTIKGIAVASAIGADFDKSLLKEYFVRLTKCQAVLICFAIGDEFADDDDDIIENAMELTRVSGELDVSLGLSIDNERSAAIDANHFGVN